MHAVRGPLVFVTGAFLATIVGPGLFQTIHEIGHDETPRVLELFHQAPTAENLHAFEKDLEQSSLVVERLRPPMQYAQFKLLADGGEKAVAGRDGWLFYRPSLRYMTERPAEVASPRAAVMDPLPAIQSFHDQLQARGISLLVVIAPNKESIYPERLSARAAGRGIQVCDRTRNVLDRLRNAGIEVVELFDEFRRAKEVGGNAERHPLYLVHDTHWSPAGALQLAAAAVAKHVLDRGWSQPGTTIYDDRLVTVERPGDLVQMLQVPRLEREIEPERITCDQVIHTGSGKPYADAPGSPVLVLGDSFLRIYERDEPGAAGFIAHLAKELRQPLSSIVNDGGASTLVRQEVARRPQLLAGKKLVIWEFVERDIGYGTEGWQVLPLSILKNDSR